MDHRSNRGGGIPSGPLGIELGHQIGTPPAHAIKASRKATLHRQAECKAAIPLNLHATESCFPWDDHVRDRRPEPDIEVRMHGCNLNLQTVADESLANWGRPCMVYGKLDGQRFQAASCR
jgi:hypothetical protein